MTLVYILGNNDQILREESIASRFTKKFRKFCELEKLELTLNEPTAIVAYTPYREQMLGNLTSRMYKWSGLASRWEKEFSGILVFYDTNIKLPKQIKQNLILMPEITPEKDKLEIWQQLTC